MNEPSDKKVKLIVLGVVVALASAVWGYSLLGNAAAAKPLPPSPKADALKAGYEKVEKPPATATNDTTPVQPSKGAHKAN